MWNKFIRWLWSWIPFQQTRWTYEYAEDLPTRLKQHRVYIVREDGQEWQVAMICPCGCEAVIQLCVLPNSSPGWVVSSHPDGTVSLMPSVWRTTGCRSHFFLRNGRIDWCR